MFNKLFKTQKENPLIDIREKILRDELRFSEYYGEKQVSAIVTDIGGKRGEGVSLICIADGSCSLYFQSGGGIIGTGMHKNVNIVLKIFFQNAANLLENKVTDFDPRYPKNNFFSIKILTKDAKYQIDGEIPNQLTHDEKASLAFTLANDIITQIRIVSEIGENRELTEDTILINFIKENNYNAFLLALEDFKNPNAIEDDKSALMISVYTGNEAMVAKLILAGAAKDYADETGMNSLMVASYLGRSGIVRKLLDSSIKNSKDKSGYTSLMFACNAGKYECVKELLEFKVDVNAKDNDNSTAIMFAAQNGFDSIASLLLEYGADTDIRGSHGLTALDFAKQNKHKSMIRLLEK